MKIVKFGYCKSNMGQIENVRRIYFFTDNRDVELGLSKHCVN